ncbi:MAG: hypothetical protein OXF06_14660 [Bacteroidetes bacterium]|nr:hypothetical protein [Bacteroidota bacterium]
MAETLARGKGGKPRQADLRRSMSTAFYAMFHYLANEFACALIGTNYQDRDSLAYRRAYRSLTHGKIRSCCNTLQIMKNFSPEIQYFTDVLTHMQSRRELADYDPDSFFFRSNVLEDIERTQKALKGS